MFDVDGLTEADLVDTGPYSDGGSTSVSLLCRLVASIFVGQLIGATLFVWMFFHLDYGLMTSAMVGVC
jgi:formate/nitrite transporter FocA (FNT family)